MASESAGNKRERRANSYDVAERAGVSQSTVSRALAGSPTITQQTRDRVVAAARELGYFVDERAARLRRGKTATLAMVVICRPGELASEINPFSYALLGAVCAAASARGLETLVSFQSEADQLYAHYVASGQADGLVVIGTPTNRAAWDYFREAQDGGGPARAAWWGSPFTGVQALRSDNETGARAATQHLIERGYRDIVFLGSPDDAQRQFAERFEGYARAMEEAGLAVRQFDTDGAGSRAEQGHAAIARLVESGQRFDAVCAACDTIALGALAELDARGIDVPGAVGIVGFDGVAAGEFSHPPLSSIRPDFAAAGEMLVARALGEDGGAARVPVSLLERGSVRRG